MPTPHFPIPRTHSVKVDLNQLLVNIERATTYVYKKEVQFQRRPEFAPSQEETACEIKLLSELRSFLQPALEAKPALYAKRRFEDRWVHLLSYDGKNGPERVLLTPTDIIDTASNQFCRINPGLAHYLGVALDITPPAPAQDVMDAAMMGYIRCFGAGILDCPMFADYAPGLELPPAETPQKLEPPRAVAPRNDVETAESKAIIDEAYKMKSLAGKARKSPLRILYLEKAASEALKWAAIGPPKKEVQQLIAEYTPQLYSKKNQLFAEDTDENKKEADKITAALEKFLEAVVRAKKPPDQAT